MTDQPKTHPDDSVVAIPGELWPRFRMWALRMGYDMDVVEGAEDRTYALVEQTQVDSSPSFGGPWL